MRPISQGHPTASRCFAWEVEGEVTAVLSDGAVQTAVDCGPGVDHRGWDGCAGGVSVVGSADA
jgi:hypothetical protein